MTKNKRTAMYWFAAAVILIFSGILTIFNPLSSQIAGYVLGSSIFIYGICNCLVFYIHRAPSNEKRWILMDAVQTFLVSFILLCNQWIPANVLSVILGMWLISTNIQRIFAALDYKKQNLKQWYLILFLASISIIVAFCSFFQFVANAFSANFIAGLLCIIQGISLLFLRTLTNQNINS